MTALPQHQMTADEFIAWSEETPGRFELHDGVVVEMMAERAVHADVKFAVQSALKTAISAAGVPCRMLPDGMRVRVSTKIVYEPDALVYCGPRVAPDAVEVANPVLVVEVLSPSTAKVDRGDKLDNYFRIPGLMHYLIVDPVRRGAIHHTRQGEAGAIVIRLYHSGSIAMNPPGITIDVVGLLET